MPSEPLRFLLDEHYPRWLAETMTADGVDTDAVQAHPELRSADDPEVLRAATAANRVVVTEDITTFPAAVAHVPGHCGVVYCHPARWPRTKAGLYTLGKALTALATDAPSGLGKHPAVWWLERPDT
ncbi:MAG: DUF5615 family PIN-like protein [Nocardioidaceae bacterium]